MALACAACAPVMHQARRAPDDLPSERELEAQQRVASCPVNAQDPQTLFRLADDALYEAKRSGSGVQFVS